jgi:hypothetical protein
MFRTMPDTEPTPAEVPPADLIPLSVLGLDVAEPITGWEPFLTVRNIPTVFDDVGRKAVSRADARTLIAEHREQQEAAEAHQRAVRERQEAAAVEADQRFRAQLPSGIPWLDLPPGVTAAEVWAATEKNARPRRRTVLEDSLEHQGTVLHPIGPTPDGDES